MSDIQLDINKVIESLTTQIAIQAQRIAMLEATIDAMKTATKEATNVDKGK